MQNKSIMSIVLGALTSLLPVIRKTGPRIIRSKAQQLAFLT